jgi:integrase
MKHQTTEGKYGTIYTIAKGVKVMMTSRKRWQLVVCEQGGRDRRQFGAGEAELNRALRAAELFVAKMNIAPVEPVEPQSPRVAQVASEWIATNKGRWAYFTIDRYVTVVRDFVNPVIGEMPVDKVKRTQVKDLLTDLLARRAAKTVELVHAVISGIFGEAIDRGYTNENPAHGLLKKILPPKHKRNQTMPDPFSKEDLDRLLETAWARLKGKYALIIETMALTGMRLGECLAMRQEHLDVTNCQYMVSETVKLGRFGRPKTGQRLIDVPAPLVAKLEAHIKELRKAALSTGVPADLLFPEITQRLIQCVLKKACRMALLRRRNPHDLRHTYASILLMAHVSPAYVQKQLGHHSITMTVDSYGHWIPGQGREEANRALVGTICQHANNDKTRVLSTGFAG